MKEPLKDPFTQNPLKKEPLKGSSKGPFKGTVLKRNPLKERTPERNPLREFKDPLKGTPLKDPFKTPLDPKP